MTEGWDLTTRIDVQVSEVHKPLPALGQVADMGSRCSWRKAACTSRMNTLVKGYQRGATGIFTCLGYAFGKPFRHRILATASSTTLRW